MKTLQKLPVGIQDFATLRENNLLYVDKTKEILDFINEGKYMFFARPHRFGKSLLCSTLKYLYQGRKELFEGLYIEDKIDWEEVKRPVIHLDLSKVDFKNISLSEGLNFHIDELGRELNFTLKSSSPQTKFNELIVGLNHREGKTVVVIVDEYDKALTDVLGNEEKFEEHKEVLRGFYGILKPNDRYLHQVVLTGVSKYGKISIFSQLNNVTDYSLFYKYVTLCGYTQEELNQYFKAHISDTATQLEMSEEELTSAIKDKYNGYSFDGFSRVYNPYSILSFFKLRQFYNFWYDTGTPNYLLKQMQKQKFKIHELEGFVTDGGVLSMADIEHESVTSLLFQTGYLTIQKATMKKGITSYTLDFPNSEVKQAFSQYLLIHYTSNGLDKINTNISRALYNALEALDFDRMVEVLKGVYASVPYSIFEKSEAFYHTIFHVTLNSIGLKTQSEVQSNIGRIDSVVETDQCIFIFEFKLDGDPSEALAQIDQNKYYQLYQNQALPIYAVGINFSSKDKNIDGWLVKKVF